MVLDYTLLAVVFVGLYNLVVYFLPDFPLGSEVTFNLLLYILSKLGVDVVGQPIREFLHRRLPRLVAPSQRQLLEGALVGKAKKSK